MTLEEAEEAVRRAYTVERSILKPGRERIIVTLLRSRQYHVLVIRQEKGREDLMNSLQACPPGSDPLALDAPGTQRIRIPLRYPRGQRPPIRPEDVVLRTGDIVYIESREADVYYTAGLLPAGEFVLPRDTDLDVVQAITRIGGSINAGGISTLNINGQLITPGFGFPSPTLVSVIRRTPGCGQVTIRVDLDRALRDPRERILIQPRDIIVLQERPEEAIGRYFSQVTKFDFFYQFVRSSRANISGTFITP
jgi:hypothetical protein